MIMINFCFDYVIDQANNIIWPNGVASQAPSLEKLVADRATWSTVSPWTDYPRILDYLRDEGVSYRCHLVDSAPLSSVYPINVNWFDHDQDYFALISQQALHRVRQHQIKILLLYSEGDNPWLIQQRLKQLCASYCIDFAQVHFVSANSSAKHIENFHYFDDDNVIYYRSQLKNKPLSWHDHPRSKKMTLLSRMHKSWRANFCSRFWQQQFHQHSYFSYKINELDQDIDPLHSELKSHCVDQFLAVCPFTADAHSDQQHNFYGTRVDEHFNNAYWNCVLETHINFEDNIAGVFVSEKTWKPIAQAQPFVVLGCAGTLDLLQQQGYKTFGTWIDESYDSITNVSQRFAKVWEVVCYLNNLSFEELHQLHLQVQPVVQHNQQLYWSNKASVLQQLFEEL
jgi:hypothetical protein